MWLMLPENVTTCYLHILLSKNIYQVIFVPNGVCPLTIDVRDIFIHMHYFCLCYMWGMFDHKPLWMLRSMHVHDALRRVMCQCVYAHCRCEWGAWSRCQKLCTASLVEAQRTVQNYIWKSKMNRKHQLTFLLFCTWVCQIRTLWRPSHTVLPILHCQETSFPSFPNSSSIDILM